MKFCLGIDIDGVLADFTSGYVKVLEAVSGKRCTLAPGEDPDRWYWATHYGFSAEDDTKAWETIRRDDTFWVSLRHLFEAPEALGVLAQMYISGHQVYFLTDRPGKHTHLQTLLWLQNLGFLVPQILVTKRKGEAAELLGITHLIDDKPENCFDVKLRSPLTQTFMLRKRYNDTPAYNAEAFRLGVTIIPSIREFFDALVREEKANAIVV